ncbi:hypothetical protein [Curtobacterium sp. MCSS17_016]|uniref:hypothetical protein n=1 Tax=Curtobacterium sp. MCSS17_016 TaxID=2175644 RepID=UPI0011B71AD5|nr:hypothetical protein [Curtobacterium sp. MCSS17_016]WIE81086.1 hypothetical protein DEJ19_021655 [Curtobacterium sp. MCSS17_016]
MRAEGIDGTVELTDTELVVILEPNPKAHRVDRWERRFALDGIITVTHRPSKRRQPDMLELVAEPRKPGHPVQRCEFRFGDEDAGGRFFAALRDTLGPLPEFDVVDAELRAQAQQLDADQQRAYRALRKRERKAVADVPESASFAGYSIRGDRIHHGASSWPVAGASADVDGTTASRVGITRTVGGAAAGTLIAPGLGTVAGALLGASAKKDASKRYITVTTTTGSFVISFHPTQETAARQFAAAINTVT